MTKTVWCLPKSQLAHTMLLTSPMYSECIYGNAGMEQDIYGFAWEMKLGKLVRNENEVEKNLQHEILIVMMMVMVVQFMVKGHICYLIDVMTSINNYKKVVGNNS